MLAVGSAWRHDRIGGPGDRVARILSEGRDRAAILRRKRIVREGDDVVPTTAPARVVQTRTNFQVRKGTSCQVCGTLSLRSTYRLFPGLLHATERWVRLHVSAVGLSWGQNGSPEHRQRHVGWSGTSSMAQAGR